MDVAKRLAEWREQPPEQWLSTVNRYLPPGVAAVLVIAIAYELATLTWALVPGGAPAVAPRGAAPPSGSVTEPSSDFNNLLSSHLFGETPKQSAAPVVEAVIDAPDTNLSLTLSGILAVGGEGEGQAIISSNRGQDKTYAVGQAVDNADGATLHLVYVDRVLLNRSGRLETLRQPPQPNGAVARAPAVSPLASPAAAGGSASGGSLRQVISQNASRLTDVVRLAPHVQEGQVVGFRVNPGRDRASFEALGLQAGDVVTDINGTVLNDPGQGLQVFESLGESTQANVTVLRDGVPQVLVIDTTQLQNLQENRE